MQDKASYQVNPFCSPEESELRDTLRDSIAEIERIAARLETALNALVASEQCETCHRAIEACTCFEPRTEIK